MLAKNASAPSRRSGVFLGVAAGASQPSTCSALNTENPCGTRRASPTGSPLSSFLTMVDQWTPCVARSPLRTCAPMLAHCLYVAQWPPQPRDCATMASHIWLPPRYAWWVVAFTGCPVSAMAAHGMDHVPAPASISRTTYAVTLAYNSWRFVRNVVGVAG